MKLVIASKNKNKIQEMKSILKPYFNEIVSAYEMGFNQEIEESGKTFAENASIKACVVSSLLNCAALADDSGLCVDALNGEPGVYSSRYSGVQGDDKANNLKLLKNMENQTNRKCRFKCSVVLAYPNGNKVFGEASCEGLLLKDFDGNNGFGYDSLFYSLDLKKSFGTATQQEKNKISHRYRALKDLIKKL